MRINPVANIAASLILAFLIFYKLGSENINVDQKRWLLRSDNFFSAISKGDFSGTYQQYHPGVTVMYLIGAGKLTYELITHDYRPARAITFEKFYLFNFWTKFYICVAIFLLIIYCQYLIFKISDSFTSVVFVLITALEVFLMGNIRNLHLDGLLTFLMFSTVLTFYYGFKTKKRKFVAISGLLFGLALLTKTVTLFTLAPVSMMTLIFLITGKNKLKRTAVDMLFFFGPSILVFILLFPAMWTSPLVTMQKIIMTGALDTGLKGGSIHYLNGIHFSDPGTRFYLNILYFRATTPVLLGAVLCIILLTASVLKKAIILNRPLLFVSLLSIVLFTLIMSLMQKKTDRYIIPVYPYLVLLSAFAYSALVKLHKAFYLMTAVVLIFNLSVMGRVFPDLLAFYNPVVGGIAQASKVIYFPQDGIATPRIAEYFTGGNFPPSTSIGFPDGELLRPQLPYKVVTLSPSMKIIPDYVVIPLHKDAEYKHNYVKESEITVNGETYWKIYKRNF